MAYNKTNWVNDSTALSAENLNHIEQGIYEAHLLIAAIYPVGCYFETTDVFFNPNNAFGGTWELEQEGLVHVSGSTGFGVQYPVSTETTKDGGDVTKQSGEANNITPSIDPVGLAPRSSIGTAISEHTHTINVMQPYKNVFRWHRTA